jgi:hypothetical protein
MPCQQASFKVPSLCTLCVHCDALISAFTLRRPAKLSVTANMSGKDGGKKTIGKAPLPTTAAPEPSHGGAAAAQATVATYTPWRGPKARRPPRALPPRKYSEAEENERTRELVSVLEMIATVLFPAEPGLVVTILRPLPGSELARLACVHKVFWMSLQTLRQQFPGPRYASVHELSIQEKMRRRALANDPDTGLPSRWLDGGERVLYRTAYM